MQSATSRAFSSLTSKIHPPLPLTPRESEQLLNLLTTSFRTHLDRAHPTETPGSDARQQSTRRPQQLGRRNASPARTLSSHHSATTHIHSILTNPLIALRPERRNSDPARSPAQEALRDPLRWFQDHIAAGTADVSKAAICLDMLERRGIGAQLGPLSETQHQKPGKQIADWLRFSGADTTKDFVDAFAIRDLPRLVNTLVKEGELAPFWRWFTPSTQLRAVETGLSEAKVSLFRTRLLRYMVGALTANRPSVDEAVELFLKAQKFITRSESDQARTVLRIPGLRIVSAITGPRRQAISPALYDALLQSSPTWAPGMWGEALLRLHHPSQPSAAASVAFIRDSAGITAMLPTASPKRRKRLVHLCLTAARQLLAEEQFADAQYVLHFASQNFPDLVGSPQEEQMTSAPAHSTEANPRIERPLSEKELAEEENLRMLDGLMPT